MNKADLIEAITEKVGDKRSAGTAVEAVIDAITRAVSKGEKVALTGFGVFEKVDRAARTARNPATGATVKLKKTSVPKFRPGQAFKEVVSGARKLTPAARPAGRPTAAVRPSTAAAKPAAAKSTATKSTATKSTATKSTATKAAASKAPARVAAAKAPAKTPAKTTAVKAPAKTTPAKAPAKTTAAVPAASRVAAKTTAKRTARA